MQSGPPGKNRKWLLVAIVIALVVAALVVAAFIVPILAIFISVSRGARHVREQEAQLCQPSVYGPVAERLALYCQSDRHLFPESISHAWFPGELQVVGEGWGDVGDSGAHIEMGGGFHHFGYRLALAESTAAAGSNTWQLFMYSEGADERLLTNVVLAATQQLAKTDLLDLGLAGFDRSLTKEGNNSEVYCGKVMLLLRYRKISKAANVCQEWIGQQPDDWLARFTYAHVQCRLGNVDGAAGQFAGWVRTNTNFAHCIYLALFQFREGRQREAVDAVRLALGQPFVEPRNTSGNKFYLGQNGALIAFQNQEYDLCLRICEKLLGDGRNEKWWKRKTWRLHAATMLMKGDQPAALESIRRAAGEQDKSMAFSAEAMSVADALLRKAIEGRDTTFISDFRNWADESDTWFSPFDTDETGIHGATDVPTPYPKSWTSDSMRPEKSDKTN